MLAESNRSSSAAGKGTMITRIDMARSAGTIRPRLRAQTLRTPVDAAEGILPPPMDGMVNEGVRARNEWGVIPNVKISVQSGFRRHRGGRKRRRVEGVEEEKPCGTASL